MKLPFRRKRGRRIGLMRRTIQLRVTWEETVELYLSEALIRSSALVAFTEADYGDHISRWALEHVMTATVRTL